MLGKILRLAHYLARQWRVILAVAVLTLLTTAVAVLHPWPMKLLVDYALADDGVPLAIGAIRFSPWMLVLAAAGASLCLFAVDSLLTVALNLSWALAGQRMVYEFAGDLFARLQRMSLLFHSRSSVGDSLSRLTEDTWCIYTVTDGLISPFQQTVTLISLAAVGFMLDPILTLWTLGVAPFLALASQIFGRYIKQRTKRGREAQSRLMSFVHQTLGAIPIVQAFGAEGRNAQEFRQLSSDAVALAQRGNLMTSLYESVTGLITTLGMAIILYVGGLRVLSGAIPLGTLLVFIAYVRQIQGASGGLFKTFANLKAAEASVDRILEVMESDELVREDLHPQVLSVPPSGQRGCLRFDRVTFGYELTQPVLRDVSFEARPGEVIALVGATGAGKSTLLSLIPRFFDPWKGVITFDDVDLRRVALAELRKQISIVLQEPFLLPLSIADNIAYGRPGSTAEEITAAAVAARADEFIHQLPQGYETVLGERGASLSGGERQRLAVARALLKDAPVLLLDEPTSALDNQTESLLIEAMQKLMQGRTTLIIAHRLSTIRHADRILVLEHGQIVESGNHEQLLSNGGLYSQLYHHQFGTANNQVVV